MTRVDPSLISFIFISLSTRYFLTMPLRNISASLFMPIFLGLVFSISFRSDSGVSTIGNSCEDRILSLFCGDITVLFMGNDRMVCEKALSSGFLFFMFRVEDDLSLTKSILKIMLLFRDVFFITDEYFRYASLVGRRLDWDRFLHSAISLGLKSSIGKSFWSVWQCELILMIWSELFRVIMGSGSFLRIGWSPNW